MAQLPSTTYSSGGRDPTDLLESAPEARTELRRLHDTGIRSAKELRHAAARARRENDPELSAFFERCALSDEARALKAKELLRSRTQLPATEEVTSAAFAAGDGATDADVSPDSRRGRVGIWPAL